ncbi:hypothetical protein LQ953_04705 [Sphingomonas sp. IC-56]|uniref:hypothetical protein n=1 Tax=Sphingomonas sp. IC-56 TaxID=2898529 RepID=UPI001E2C3D3D|nr:hypothetical protein [Sphingomonas sp. IC-56]MCD2323314.1 hypothetical protein [Sphingomonas sp. IC-56]
MASLIGSNQPLQRKGLITPARVLFFTLCATLLPAEPFSALAAGLYFLYALQSSPQANARAANLYLPFVLMAAYALLVAGDNEKYLAAKDAWYAFKLCICLGLGYLLGYSTDSSMPVLKGIVLFSTLSAALVVGVFFIFGITPLAPGQADASVFRLPLVSVAALPVLLEQLKGTSGSRRASTGGQLCLLLVAILVSDSRVTILSALAMVLAWLGYLANTRKAIVGVLVFGAFIAAIWQVLPEYNGGPLTLAVKLRRSLDEVLLTDGFDPTQMLLNWRGFEAYNAQLMFDNASLGRKLFGHGLGAAVDLGTTIDIGGDEPFRFLPILHNGFYNVLIKYGIVGVGIYTVAVLRLALMGMAVDGRGLLEDRILRGLIIVVLLSTAVITGLYNKSVLHGVELIIAWAIGLLSRYKETMRTLPAPSGVSDIPRSA